jgi:hypothetical protein
MYHDDVRRHPDGSLDFDFHRRRAARKRARAVRDLFKRQTMFRNPLFGAAVLAAIAMAIATPVGKNAPDPSLAGRHSAPNGPT